MFFCSLLLSVSGFYGIFLVIPILNCFIRCSSLVEFLKRQAVSLGRMYILKGPEKVV